MGPWRERGAPCITALLWLPALGMVRGEGLSHQQRETPTGQPSLAEPGLALLIRGKQGHAFLSMSSRRAARRLCLAQVALGCAFGVTSRGANCARDRGRQGQRGTYPSWDARPELNPVADVQQRLSSLHTQERTLINSYC